MNTPEDFLKGRNIKDRTIRVLTFNDKNYMLTDLMLDYAKVYAETLVKKCDLAAVVGQSEQLKPNGSYYSECECGNLVHAREKNCKKCGL